MAKTIGEVVRDWREASKALKAWRALEFPSGTVVKVNCPRFTGQGIVDSQSEVAADLLAVRLENGNVWWYPVEACSVVTDAKCPKCGAGDVVKGHAAATFALPEAYFWRCDACDHQWGHS